MSLGFVPSSHPVLPLPTPAETIALGEAGWISALKKREDIIRKEQDDPLRHGWEPPIWKVCDALLGFDRPEADWSVIAEIIRQRLGFKVLVKILLILGGNRSGKSEYVSKRTVKLISYSRSKRVWMFHTSNQMSIEYQQPLIWKYLPAEIRKAVSKKAVREAMEYISFTRKNGFPDGRVIMPTESEISFRNYEQKRDTIEGGEIDLAAPDELCPPDWMETLELRIATRGGAIILSFTPVDGYTETVAMMCDGAQTVLESIGFLLPKDGQPADIARALGLTEAELEHVIAEAEASARERRPARLHAPRSRPEDCMKWTDPALGRQLGCGQLPVPAGRSFEKVPRVLRCAHPEGNRAVVHFHSADNPYGNPLEVWKLIRGKSPAFIRERWYGIANKTIAGKFPKFSVKTHVVPASRAPKAGTNYQLTDPAGSRNPFMLWIRATPRGHYVYREWPNQHTEIPGVGVLGPWALPGGGIINGRRRHDGKLGPGQAPSLGWGYLANKVEIARLEGWADYKAKKPDGMDEKEWQRSWRAENGAAEAIFQRIIDSRPASAPREEDDRPTTLLTQFEDIGLVYVPAPGDDIEEGVQDINDALDYREDEPVNEFNEPHLYISEECQNLIFAMGKWTGADGNKGATKDPIDLLRYYFRAGCEHYEADAFESSGGGHY